MYNMYKKINPKSRGETQEDRRNFWEQCWKNDGKEERKPFKPGDRAWLMKMEGSHIASFPHIYYRPVKIVEAKSRDRYLIEFHNEDNCKVVKGYRLMHLEDICIDMVKDSLW